MCETLRMRDFLTVGAVAREAGVNASALRFYETLGVLPRAERRPNGYRVYPREAVDWVRFLRRAQAFGMTLEEIGQLLRLDGRVDGRCRRVREITRVRLRDVETKMKELAALRGQLRALLRRRARPTRGGFCPLIEGGQRGRAEPSAGERRASSTPGRRSAA